MTDKENLIWLAAIIDGEGYLGLNRQKTKYNYYHNPTLTISNSDPRIINKVVGVVKKYTHYYIETKQPKYIYKNDNNKRTRPCFNVTVRGVSRLAPLLREVTPYLIGKQDQALLLLTFCENSKSYNEADREMLATKMTLLKNPQRAYDEQFENVRIDDVLRPRIERTS